MCRIDASSNDSNNAQATPHWYVIYTKSRCEELVQEELQKKGISVFLPRIRAVRFRTYRLQEHIEPLFPTYLFAKFTIPDAYYDVKWSRGLKYIVGSGHTPIPLDDSIVMLLRHLVDREGLIRPKPSLKVGDMVRVNQGPLEGLWGVVHGQIDPKGRVRILMDILHSRAKVELPYWYLKKYE